MKNKKIGLQVSILMSLTLSLCLSLSGNLLSGHFIVKGFLISLLTSIVISIIISLLVPMKKVGEGVVARSGLREHSISARCLESFVSDLIYTPVITLVMVFMAYKSASKHDADITIAPMIIRSLLLSLMLGFVLIFVFQPLFVKLVLKRSGMSAPPKGGPPEK